MSIQLSLTVTGGELGMALANDPEEFAYALEAMSEWDGEELGAEVAGYMPYQSPAVVAAFLRSLAEKIEEAEA